jgi:hypothetical protein
MKSFKKLLFILMALSIVAVSCNKDDDDDDDTNLNLVKKTAQARNVVLEEFTGINCGYCPQGHQVAKDIYDANPGRVLVIGIHTNSYSSSYPEFLTDYGTDLASFMGVTGYPNGAVNREEYNGSLSMGRGSWASAADAILNSGNSPVNIGLKSEWDAGTRKLTITVQMYYTSAESGSNKLNVGLTESHVFGPQSGGNAGNNYEHMHILRDLVTGLYGEEITETASGSEITKTYTYTVDNAWNIDNCEVFAFVTRSDNKHIHTGIEVEAKDGQTQGD